MDVETLDYKIKQDIILAATKAIPKSKGKNKRKVMSWWDDVCKEVIKNRNKAF